MSTLMVLSPLAWGNHPDSTEPTPLPGSIPAWAGEPLGRESMGASQNCVRLSTMLFPGGLLRTMEPGRAATNASAYFIRASR